MRQNPTDSEKSLSRKQLSALPHIATSASISEGARRADISRSAIYKWLDDPNFRQALDNLREEIAEIAKAKIQDMMITALQVIEDSLHDESERVRLRAAVATLDIAQKAITNQDLTRRMDYVEDAMSLQKEPRW